METFKNAILIAKSYEDPISIGGGEPTLHKKFTDMLMYAIAFGGSRDYPIHIVHNGTHKDRSLLLLKLYELGAIIGGMSYDQYHNLEMIDEEVLSAYRENPKFLWGQGSYVLQGNPYRDEFTLVAAGRGKKIKGAGKGCGCDGAIVKPSGDVFYCACENAPKTGNVNGILREHSSICWNEKEE